MNTTVLPEFFVGCILKEEVPTQLAQIISYALMCISYTLPMLLCVSLCYACFWRDTHTIYVLCAVMLNAVWVVTVKELTRIDRPRSLVCVGGGGGHSMPSLYASVVVFLCTYYVYQFWRHARGVWTTKTLVARITACVVYAMLVCYSRVHLVMARPEDVLVGSIVGSACTIAFLFILKRHRYTQYKSSLKAD